MTALAPHLQVCSSGPPHLRKLVSIPRLQIPLHFRHELVQRGCQVGLLLVLQTRMSHVRLLQIQHAMNHALLELYEKRARVYKMHL